MNTYHIVFKELVTDHMSKGLNFENSYPETALSTFRARFPDALFIALYDLDAIIEIKGGAKREVTTNIDARINNTINLAESFEQMKANT